MSPLLGRALAPSVLLMAGSTDLPRQKTRREVYKHVKRYPGLHLSEIARQLDIPTNHAKYHLRRLENDDMVSSFKEDGYWRFFPRADGSVGTRDLVDREEKRLLAMLRRPKPLHIVIHLLSTGEATHGELTDVLDVAGATAHYHLQRMEDAGLLERRPDGRRVYYALARPDEVARLLDRYEPPDELVSGFLDAWEDVSLW